MSVVKVPALASRCFVSHPGIANSLEPSHSSILKAQAASLYFQERFLQFARSKERREQDRQELLNSGLPPDQLEDLIRQYDEQETEQTRITRSRIKPDRFERIALIGRGGFGHVWLVNDTKTNNKYALKVLRKSDIIQTEQVANVRTERDVLAYTHNPWIANLEYSFQDSNHLYLVLEFVQGGDLMNLLIKRSILAENEAKFYCGEIALALQSIHSLGLIHLDLKPDNILISSTGHLKLTDFGLATYYRRTDARFRNLLSDLQEYLLNPDSLFMGDKKHRDRASLVATCDYTAPEVIMQSSKGTSADWWSFGVILYEMLCGFSPFYAESTQQTAINVLNYQKTLRFPPGRPISREARELLIHLLCPAQNRWGFEEVSKCAFFQQSRGSPPFDFGNPQLNTPPLIPALKNPIDTSFFDIGDITPSEDPTPEIPVSQEMAKFAFLGFTFKKDQRPKVV